MAQSCPPPRLSMSAMECSPKHAVPTCRPARITRASTNSDARNQSKPAVGSPTQYAVRIAQHPGRQCHAPAPAASGRQRLWRDLMVE